MTRIFLIFALFALFLFLSSCDLLVSGNRQRVCGGGGDINTNGIPFEIADIVMFTNYLIVGPPAFSNHVAESIAQSDVNGDGKRHTVADLVYMIRKNLGDVEPACGAKPVAATITYSRGCFSVDVEMGAALIIMEGSITPRLLATRMDMKYNHLNGNTHILVYGTEVGARFSGDFLEVNGEIVNTEFATYEGAPVVAKVLLVQFVVHQNYPNPFNATTKIRFEIPGAGPWRLVIRNTIGATVARFSGVSITGFEEVLWDASDLPSGNYFYTVTAGGESITKKATLIK